MAQQAQTGEARKSLRHNADGVFDMHSSHLVPPSTIQGACSSSGHQLRQAFAPHVFKSEACDGTAASRQ